MTYSTAYALTAEQIIRKAEQAAYYAGDDGSSLARIIIVDQQGRKLMRQFSLLRKDVIENGQQTGQQNLLVMFSRPTDIKGTVFRVEKSNNIEQDDNRWLYLPGLDLVKRIAASDKRTSFVGSHFFYEDVSGRSTLLDNFELLDSSGENYLIKATPKQPESVEFSHYTVQIHKQNFIPVTIDYYNQDNKHYRRVEAIQIETLQNHPTVTRSKVSDLISGGYTLMEFRNVQYDIGLPDSLFSERSLRYPPSQWFK
ncbi:outer membrane lipoprotein-sorting protein [Saccharobesus litoralis]|nr:outer membrane lipoprotein-sorting protein [Saccharobesus litoralis]